MTTDSAREAAVAASTEATFSFLDRMTGRNYPTEEVVVFMDEAGAYKRNKLQRQIAEETYLLKGDTAEKAKARGKKITIMQNKLDEMTAEIAESRVVFHLEGIPTEQYDALIDDAAEQFPYEYVESRNPLTMKLEREVKENADRDVYFRSNLWAAFVRKISDASGAEDTTHTPEYMRAVMGAMPIVGVAHVQTAIEQLRMVTDWMDEIQTDDFFPKS